MYDNLTAATNAILWCRHVTPMNRTGYEDIGCFLLCDNMVLASMNVTGFKQHCISACYRRSIVFSLQDLLIAIWRSGNKPITNTVASTRTGWPQSKRNEIPRVFPGFPEPYLYFSTGYHNKIKSTALSRTR